MSVSYAYGCLEDLVSLVWKTYFLLSIRAPAASYRTAVGT